MGGKLILLLAIIGLLAVGISTAAPENATTTVGTTGTSTAVTGTAGQATAEGGNVTNVDIAQTSSTSRWQGFYGNVSANLVLGQGADSFYLFDAPATTAIYASTNNAFNWGGVLAAATGSAINSLWTMGANTDNATNVYTDGAYTNADFGFNTASVGVGGHTSFALGVGALAAKNDIAFGSEVESQQGFQNAFWDYEMLVPTNSGATETYYFYLSLA